MEVTERPKFKDPKLTAKGERRASVELKNLHTLWFNTGTRCNLTCENCYIESSPENDRLVYLEVADVEPYLAEIKQTNLPTKEIGFTGGEPFLNPKMADILETTLSQGFEVLVLTNAMRFKPRLQQRLLAMKQRFPNKITMRISIDHHSQALHEEERGAGSWLPMIEGMQWLAENGFQIDVAGRTRWGDDETELRKGYEQLFKQLGINLNAWDQHHLVLFPEMDETAPVPEITTECWQILGVNPDAMMCASSRMVVKHKGDSSCSVMACTLLAYDQQFNLGTTLAEASGAVPLNHPHCAKFCVLGGGSCSA